MIQKKRNKNFWIFLIFLVLSLNIISVCLADSIIKGKVYDFSYEELETVRITIDTKPEQVIISKDSSYLFEVEKGNYTITAIYQDLNLGDLEVKENVSIVSEGTYNIDLVLFPTFEDDELLQDFNEFVKFETEYAINQKKEGNLSIVLQVIALSFAIFIFLIIFIIWRLRKKKRHLKRKRKKVKAIVENEAANYDTDYVQQIVHLLEKNNGRLTQRDIRKNISLSESKISLIIKQLESEKKVKKLKSGRGNIIVLLKNKD